MPVLRPSFVLFFAVPRVRIVLVNQHSLQRLHNLKRNPILFALTTFFISSILSPTFPRELAHMTDLAAIQPVLDDFVPLCQTFGRGRWSIAIGGSFGKGSNDRTSDLDMSYYCDELAMSWGEIEAAFMPLVRKWDALGVKVDGVWVRLIPEIETALAGWLAGEVRPVELVWSVWGYHLLPDLYHQRIILDPYHVAADWKARLAVYPPVLQRAVIRKHLGSLQYWRRDYHYASKVRRGDIVFLAGLSARLVHDMCQVIFALNERYFVGDGQNLRFIAGMALQPRDFSARVQQALYPAPGEHMYEEQYAVLCGLIDELGGIVQESGVLAAR
ncbi:MAG: DUF4037 domain-containing protein [Anaerolineae bacterium]